MSLEVHIVFEQGVADMTIVFLPFGRRWNVWIVFNVDMILETCCELKFFIADIIPTNHSVDLKNDIQQP